MKLINYKCTNCNHQEEELYRSNEKIKASIVCQKCGKKMKQFNFKCNTQRVKIFD